MAQTIHETEEFIGLSHFITKLSDRNKDLNDLTRQQTLRLKSLITPLISQIQTNLEAISMLDQGQKNLSFLFSAISLYLRQNPEKELESQISKLKEEIISAQTKSLDDQQDIILNAENSLISRISDKLNIQNQITNEDELTDYILSKISNDDSFINELIKAFNIPPTIKKTEIISFIQNQIQQQSTTQKVKNDNKQFLMLQAEIEDLQNVINAKNEHIKRLREEKNEAKSQLKDALNALQEEPNDKSDQDDLSPESLVNIELEQLKAQLLTSKIENDKKDRKIEKQTKSIEQYEEAIKNLEQENSELKGIHSQSAEIEKSQIEFNANVEFQRKLDQKDIEVEQMKRALNELANQFDQQSTELADMASVRLNLVSYIQRLDAAFTVFEDQLLKSNDREKELSEGLEEAVKKIEEYEKNEKEHQKEKLNRDIQNSFDENFLRSIEQLTIESFPESTEQINQISDDDQTSLGQRVRHLFTFVIEKSKQKSPTNCQEEDENQRFVNLKTLASKFYSASLSQLRFIRELANNKQVQAWILDEDEDISVLKTQCAKMESFIADNCSNVKQYSNIFDILLLQSDPISLSAHLAEFIETYKNPKTNEGKVLFLMLVQALNANDILQKYSIEARNHCDIQSKEIKSLRNIIENHNTFQQQNKRPPPNDNFLTESEIDHSNLSIVSPKNDNITKIKNIIRNSIGKGHDLQTMLKCLDKLEGTEIDDSKYTRKLEKKLSQQLHELNKTRNRLNSISIDNQELTTLKAKLAEVSKELEKRSNEIAAKEEEVQTMIQSKNNEISQLQTELKQKEEENSIIKESKEKETQNEMEATRDHYNEIVNKLQEDLMQIQHSYEIFQMKSNKKIQELKSSNKKNLNEFNTTLKTIQEKLNQCELQKRSMEDEFAQKIEQYQTSENDFLNEIKKLNEINSDMKSKLSSMTVEQKLMKTRLSSQEGKLQREKQNFDAQLKLHTLALENDMKAKMEKCQNDLKEKHQQFLTNISRLFHEMIDVTTPINDDTIDDLLQKVRLRLTSLDRESFTADESNIELVKIKNIIEPFMSSKYLKVSGAVRDLINEYESIQASKEKLEKEIIANKKEIIEARSIIKSNLNNQEWEDWSKKIYAMICDGFAFSKSPKEMRNAIENVIFASIGDQIILRWLDCLRCEKKLILKGVLRVKPKKSNEVNLTQLITIGLVINRLQKLSGHAISSLSLFKEPQNTFDRLSFNKIDTSDLKKSKRSNAGSKIPLFSQFVVQPSYLGASNIDNS